MPYKYKVISLRTAKGIKEAERYQNLGWKVISSGFDTVTMEKKVTSKRK